MYDVDRRAAELVAGRDFDRDVAVSGGSWAAAVAAALREAYAAGYREGWAAAIEAAERAAARFANEAAERGTMIGGLPMHDREIADRSLGELVARNVAAAVRALKGGGPCS